MTDVCSPLDNGLWRLWRCMCAGGCQRCVAHLAGNTCPIRQQLWNRAEPGTQIMEHRDVQEGSGLIVVYT